MIGLDTNVVVRYTMQDNPQQYSLAATLIEKLTIDDPGFVPLVVVIELVWVLSSSFELARAQIISALEILLQIKEIQVERAEVVWRALRVYQGSSADFADCMVERSAAAAGCLRTMTLDRSAAKSYSMTLLH